MKTAMQEMLEWVRRIFPMDLDTPRMIEDKIESLLEKEKEQLIQAHIDAFDNIVVEFKKRDLAEQYYNKKYNQKK
jgi:uncharacterized protein (DUF2164 family)